MGFPDVRSLRLPPCVPGAWREAGTTLARAYRSSIILHGLTVLDNDVSAGVATNPIDGLNAALSFGPYLR